MAMYGPLVAGVDVGGTNVEVGLVGDDHTVLDRAKADTPTEGPDAVLDVIADLVGSLDGSPIAVGFGIPGVVHEGRVLTVPNLANWHDPFDLSADLGKRTGLPVALGNDANVGLLGEWLDGAAKGARSVLGLWMGTGIGGGLILDGRPFAGSHGAAGEIGHVIVSAGGALCSCGRRGCVEGYAGRRSMAGVASAMVEAGRGTALFDIRDDEGKTKLTSKVWARAVRGRPAGRRAVRHGGRHPRGRGRVSDQPSGPRVGRRRRRVGRETGSGSGRPDRRGRRAVDAAAEPRPGVRGLEPGRRCRRGRCGVVGSGAGDQGLGAAESSVDRRGDSGPSCSMTAV